mgnify:CR=1 FL=1|tara:strand:+ start:621 stop:1511 length:891 start_codon:yes stop_codon:yes gene_type:complete
MATDEGVIHKDFCDTEGLKAKTCPDSGGLMITDQNKDRYDRIESLKEAIENGSFANTANQTYVWEPDTISNAPTEEEITSLRLQHIKMKGRIVMQGGGVYDADMENWLAGEYGSIDMQEISQLDEHFIKSMEFIMNAGMIRCINSQEQISTMMPRYPEHFRGTGEFIPPQQFAVSSTVSDEYKNVKFLRETIIEADGEKRMCPPNGIYNIKENNSHTVEEVITSYAICDMPKCCKMTHLYLLSANMPNCDEDARVLIKAFLDKRTMYTCKDPLKGNFDICYMCLSTAGYPITNERI